MTATITKPTKKSTKEKPQSPYKRLHVIIPIEDMLWASQQKPSVNQLWQECWTLDPYGSRWMPLSTALGYSSFICAKKILSASGLFIFKPDKSIQDGRETVGWMVRNLHGSRMKEFWEKSNAEKPNSTKQESNAESTEKKAGSQEISALYAASISDKTQSEQGFVEPSRTVQEHLTNSSKEIVRCASSTSSEILRVDEAAMPSAASNAPLGGASPQTIKSVEEKEELPTVTDCTTLTLVKAVPNQSASLIEKNQDLGVGQGASHEDTFSAAPVVPDFSVQTSHPASLGEKNQELGDESGASHEDHSAAPQVEAVTTLDKWSHAAIVQRRELRPKREIRLRLCGITGENPGFEFLAECWEDVALWNKIKQLIARYPQWGITFADDGIHLVESTI